MKGGGARAAIAKRQMSICTAITGGNPVILQSSEGDKITLPVSEPPSDDYTLQPGDCDSPGDTLQNGFPITMAAHLKIPIGDEQKITNVSPILSELNGEVDQFGRLKYSITHEFEVSSKTTEQHNFSAKFVLLKPSTNCKSPPDYKQQSYQHGERVSFSGMIYSCVREHDSYECSDPTNPSFWNCVGDKADILSKPSPSILLSDASVINANGEVVVKISETKPCQQAKTDFSRGAQEESTSVSLTTSEKDFIVINIDRIPQVSVGEQCKITIVVNFIASIPFTDIGDGESMLAIVPMFPQTYNENGTIQRANISFEELTNHTLTPEAIQALYTDTMESFYHGKRIKVEHPEYGEIGLCGYYGKEVPAGNRITDDSTEEKTVIQPDSFRFSSKEHDWDISLDSITDIQKSSLGAINLVLATGNETWNASGKFLLPTHLYFCAKKSNGTSIDNSRCPDVCLATPEGSLQTMTIPIQFEQTEKKVYLLIAVDESGSTSFIDYEGKRVFEWERDGLKGVLQLISEKKLPEGSIVDVIFCDTTNTFQKEIVIPEVSSSEELLKTLITFYESLKTSPNGGGTSFGPILEYAQDKLREYPEHDHAMIHLTDGCTWVMSKKDCLELKESIQRQYPTWSYIIAGFGRLVDTNYVKQLGDYSYVINSIGESRIPQIMEFLDNCWDNMTCRSGGILTVKNAKVLALSSDQTNSEKIKIIRDPSGTSLFGNNHVASIDGVQNNSQMTLFLLTDPGTKPEFTIKERVVKEASEDSGFEVVDDGEPMIDSTETVITTPDTINFKLPASKEELDSFIKSRLEFKREQITKTPDNITEILSSDDGQTWEKGATFLLLYLMTQESNLLYTQDYGEELVSASDVSIQFCETPWRLFRMLSILANLPFCFTNDNKVTMGQATTKVPDSCIHPGWHEKPNQVLLKKLNDSAIFQQPNEFVPPPNGTAKRTFCLERSYMRGGRGKMRGGGGKMRGVTSKGIPRASRGMSSEESSFTYRSMSSQSDATTFRSLGASSNPPTFRSLGASPPTRPSMEAHSSPKRQKKETKIGIVFDIESLRSNQTVLYGICNTDLMLEVFQFPVNELQTNMVIDVKRNALLRNSFDNAIMIRKIAHAIFQTYLFHLSHLKPKSEPRIEEMDISQEKVTNAFEAMLGAS